MAARTLPELVIYRETHNPPLSRKQLGERLGVSSVTIYRWEMGKRTPDRQHAPAISELTGVPILTLMGVDA